jgi:hypothetical protein
MLKLIFLYTIVIFCGLLAIAIIGIVVGLLLPVAEGPVIISLSALWLWACWNTHASETDAQVGQNKNEAIAAPGRLLALRLPFSRPRNPPVIQRGTFIV